MSKKNLLLLALFTFLVFSNTLFFGFTGDDVFLFSENDFYRSWQNLPRLFSPDYSMDSDKIFNNVNGSYSHSGSVAYRPVLSLTYFLDYALWGSHPWGYHLQNVIWHVLNVLLVYALVWSIIRQTGPAFFSALLFSVHPLRSEPVCAIGYRADSVACFFLLSAFLFYIHSFRKNTRGRQGMFFLLSLLSYAAAIFAKESAVVFPVLLLWHDWCLPKDTIENIFKNFWKRYGPFWAVTFGYLFVYARVFPNHTLETLVWMNGSLPAHALSAFAILGGYLGAFLFPPAVGILPPFYAPMLTLGARLNALWALIFCFLFVFYCLRRGPHRPVSFFWLGWFVLTFIPVSNIIPLVNPMAYRFMYLPSIGLSVFVVLTSKKIFQTQILMPRRWVKKTVVSGGIALCMVLTVALNTAWTNNALLAFRMMQDYPRNPRGYLYAGSNALERKEYLRACGFLKKSLSLGLKDPRAYYMAGAYCLGLGSATDQANYFLRSIQEFPQYGLSYVGLGRWLLFQERQAEFVRSLGTGPAQNASEARRSGQALTYLKKGVTLTPVYAAWAYLIQAHLLRGERSQAEAVLRRAEETLREESLRASLRKLLTEPVENLPVDVGL